MSGRAGQAGFTLLEALFAMVILAIAIAGLLPSFLVYADANTYNELRTGSIQAARTKLEGLRTVQPSLLPDTGTTGPETMQIGERSYEVLTRYCVVAAFCDDTSRHLLVEVSHQGRRFYTAETVYVALR